MNTASAIQIYKSIRFGDIRVLEEGGNALFVASDVAKALGYDQAAFMTRSFDEDEKGLRVVQTPGGDQQMTVITEAGLYHALNMRRAACVKDPVVREQVIAFQRWVNHEVIPSIRRNGAYINPVGAETPEELIARALRAADAIIAKREQCIAALESEAQELRPRAAFAAAVEGSRNSILVREMAKILNQNGVDVGQNRLFSWLRRDGYLIRAVGRDRNQPSQKSMKLGFMEVKETVIETAKGSKTRQTPLITGKGQIYFFKRYAEGRTDGSSKDEL